MKILSYNVNGIRAALNKDLINWLKSEDPDIICIQETKAQNGQFDTKLFEESGYYHFWLDAVKKGYSGVGILSKQKPNHVEYGLGNSKYDTEGRNIRLDFDDFSIMSVYVPSGTMGGPRQNYKMEFIYDFHDYLLNLRKQIPNLIISGDYNICHKPIDINHPERHKKTSGFLPEEREWFDKFVESGFIDTFREFNSEPEQYSWWSYRAGARAKNLGWRIDYHMITKELKSRLKNAGILQNVFHSDHCPVFIEIE